MGSSTKSLTFQPSDSLTTYLISVTTSEVSPSDDHEQHQVILLNRNHPITLLHNQEFEYTFVGSKEGQ